MNLIDIGNNIIIDPNKITVIAVLEKSGSYDVKIVHDKGITRVRCANLENALDCFDNIKYKLKIK